MLGELVAIVVPVYVCAGIGFLWVRSGRAYDTALMTDLVVYIGAPSLVFSSLVSQSITGDVLAEMLGAVVVAIFSLGALAAGVLWISGLSVRTYLAPMTFGNAGNMGLPLCYFAFGEAGLALGVCYFVVGALLHFTVGQAIWSGRASFGELVRSPLVWSVLLASGVLAADVEVPRWLFRTTTLLGDFTIPIMQLTLGVSLAGLEVAHVKKSVLLSCLKIGGGAAIGFAVGHALDLGPLARGVLALQCAMPVAVFNYMFAVRFDRAPTEVASVIVVSTLIALFTTPLLIAQILQ